MKLEIAYGHNMGNVTHTALAKLAAIQYKLLQHWSYEDNVGFDVLYDYAMVAGIPDSKLGDEWQFQGMQCTFCLQLADGDDVVAIYPDGQAIVMWANEIPTQYLVTRV